jgi:hypothetical protein
LDLLSGSGLLIHTCPLGLNRDLRDEYRQAEELSMIRITHLRALRHKGVASDQQDVVDRGSMQRFRSRLLKDGRQYTRRTS